MTALNLVVLALAAHRLFRIIAGDTITKRWRERFLGWGDDQKRNEWPKNRRKLAEFVHCPFCLGFWVVVVEWLAFQQWPHGVLLVAWPLALSSIVGLVTERLDS